MTTSPQLGEEFLDPLQPRRQLRRRAGVADAQAARLAEGRARHAGHALGFEQRVAQFDIVADDLAVVRLAEGDADVRERVRSEEHTSELQSLMRISYAVFCLKKKNKKPISKA